jgi:hypothetical protein
MRFFVEESGNFALAPQPDSWCVLAAFVLSDAQYPRALAALRDFKIDVGADPEVEYKDRRVLQASYCRFLMALREAGGVLVCVATDAGLYDDINADRVAQAELVRQGYPGAAGVHLAELLLRLSDQLFVDMMCRLELAWRAVQIGTLYFVRRDPATLGAFEWRCDAKNRIAEPYGPLWAGVAMTLSRRHPLLLAQGGDYRAMDALARRADNEGRHMYDASTLCLDQLQFVDSRQEPGIQIADWLAWGCRRCLRGEFDDIHQLTRLLGRLMRRTPDDDHALIPIVFAPAGPVDVGEATRTAIVELTQHARVVQ